MLYAEGFEWIYPKPGKLRLDVAGSGRVLKIVHVASGDLWAGAEVQIYGLAKFLALDESIDLLVVLLNHGVLERRLLELNISVQVFDESKLNGFRVLARIVRLLREFRPDIVHTHRRKENVLGSLACVLVPRAVCIRTAHGAPEFAFRSWQLGQMLFRALDWICGRYLQRRVIAVSVDLGTMLQEKFPQSRIAVIENGVNVKEVQNRAHDVVEVPGPVGAIRVAGIGRLVPVKRLDIFLRVAQRLLTEGEREFSFYIFGEGPLYEQLKEMAEELEIIDSVFLMGFKEEIAAYIAKMDIILMTSDHEGLPTALLEALCLGVPVVAHAVGGIPALLRSGEFGRLVHRQSVQAYVEAVTECTRNRERCRAIAAAGGLFVRNHYTSQNAARRYARLYRELLR